MDELIHTPTPEPDYTPPDFLIETVTDPEGIHACILHMLPNRRYRLNLVLGLLLLAVSPTLFIMGETALGIIGLVVGIYSLIFFVTFPGRVAKNQVAKVEEIYGTDAVPSQLVFWPQGVVFNNKISGGSAKFRYDIIRIIARCGEHLILRTAEKQSVILRRMDLENEAAFIAYLKNHCPGAKFIGL